MPIPEGTPTRERILLASAELFRHQGYAGTGLKQIATESQAPFGSIYHHFRGGKEDLAVEALRRGGAFFLALYRYVVAEAPDFDAAIESFFDGAAETLVATDYADACPIATVAGEIASTHPRLRRSADLVFAGWLSALAEDLEAAGIPRVEADDVALAILSLLEGAFLLSRTQRRTDPMRAASAAARELLASARRGS